MSIAFIEQKCQMSHIREFIVTMGPVCVCVYDVRSLALNTWHSALLSFIFFLYSIREKWFELRRYTVRFILFFIFYLSVIFMTTNTHVAHDINVDAAPSPLPIDKDVMLYRFAVGSALYWISWNHRIPLPSTRRRWVVCGMCHVTRVCNSIASKYKLKFSRVCTAQNNNNLLSQTHTESM